MHKVENGTSLHIACVWDKIELAKLLLSSGANVDAVCAKAVRDNFAVVRDSLQIKYLPVSAFVWRHWLWLRAWLLLLVAGWRHGLLWWPPFCAGPACC